VPQSTAVAECPTEHILGWQRQMSKQARQATLRTRSQLQQLIQPIIDLPPYMLNLVVLLSPYNPYLSIDAEVNETETPSQSGLVRWLIAGTDYDATPGGLACMGEPSFGEYFGDSETTKSCIGQWYPPPTTRAPPFAVR
jgi:hypothetical protein